MTTHFEYITSNPKILGGKPILKGSRISVELVLEWIANGSNVAEIIKEFPQISAEAVKEAILYAAAVTNSTSFFEIELAA